jgi:SAM-dependent methyltransferase
MIYAHRMFDTLLRLFGWRFLLITGDPCVFDRWLWVRSHLRAGDLRTFDAGSGNGGFSVFAAKIGNDVLAATFQPNEQRDALRRATAVGVAGIDFRVLDLRELEDQRAGLGLFDQIICLETIEHVNDDAGLIRSMARMLKPGGRLLLSTPFDGHRPMYTEERNPSNLEDGSHVRYGYAPADLRRIVDAAGLDVESESFVSGVISQKTTDLMRRLTARLGPMSAWAIVLPLRALVVFDGALSRILRYPHLSLALCAVNRSANGMV